jgi:hypothetical protein
MTSVFIELLAEEGLVRCMAAGRQTLVKCKYGIKREALMLYQQVSSSIPKRKFVKLFLGQMYVCIVMIIIGKEPNFYKK